MNFFLKFPTVYLLKPVHAKCEKELHENLPLLNVVSFDDVLNKLKNHVKFIANKDSMTWIVYQKNGAGYIPLSKHSNLKSAIFHAQQ